ncbi:hypothetical protein KBB12_02615 [Candidatus Woesebacteria bacterium]|nr:hypothetical protein [Candidatus Woesebacteria bacterium]
MSIEQSPLTKEQMLVSTRQALGERPAYTTLDVLEEVAERAGFTREQYLQLVGGQEGEVTAEFDTAAEAALGRATQQMSRVLRYVDDHRGLVAALNEVEESHRGHATQLDAIRQLRKVLVGEIQRGAKGVGELLKADASERAHLQAHATEGGIHALSTSLEEKNTGTQLNTLYMMEHGYYDDLAASFKETPREFSENVYPHVAVEKHKSHDNPPAFVRYVQLESAKAVALAGRFLNGERSAMRVTGSEYDVIVDAVRQFEPRVAQAATRLVEAGSSAIVTNLEALYAEKTSKTVTITSEFGTPKEVVDPRSDIRERLRAEIAEVDAIPMLQRGVLQGVLASDMETMFSVESLVSRAAGLGGSGLYEPKQNDKLHHRETYKQACLAGFAVGTLGRNDLQDNNSRLLSLRRAYNAVTNPSLKSTLADILRTQRSERPQHRIAIALTLGENEGLSDSEKAALEKKRTELNLFENQARMQHVRETIYDRPAAGYLGDHKEFGAREARIDSPEKADIVRQQGREAIAQREVSYHALATLLSQLGSRTDGQQPIWEDAEAVVSLMDRGIGSMRDKHDFGRLIAPEAGLSAHQIKLATMMRVSHLFAGGVRGDYWGAIQEINKLCSDGRIDAKDIVYVHNATLAATEGVSRAYAKGNATRKSPPLEFVSMITDIANQTESLRGAYGQSARTGPFADSEPIPIGERVGSTTGSLDDGGPRYYPSANGGVNSSQIEFYSIKGMGQSERPNVRVDMEKATRESAQAFDAFDALTDQSQAERYPSRSFAQVTNVQELRNYKLKLSADEVKERVNRYGWSFVDKMSRALGPLAESMTKSEAGGVLSDVENARTAVLQYKEVSKILAEVEGFVAENGGLTKGGKRKEYGGVARNRILIALGGAKDKNLIEPPTDLHDSKKLAAYRESLDTWIVPQVDAVVSALADLKKTLIDTQDPAQQVLKTRMQKPGYVSPLIATLERSYGQPTTTYKPHEVSVLRLATERDGTDGRADVLRALLTEVDEAYAAVPDLANITDTLSLEARGYQYGTDIKPERFGYVLSILTANLENVQALKEQSAEIALLLADIRIAANDLGDYSQGRVRLQKALEAAYEVQTGMMNARTDDEKEQVRQATKDALPRSMSEVLLK